MEAGVGSEGRELGEHPEGTGRFQGEIHTRAGGSSRRGHLLGYILGGDILAFSNLVDAPVLKIK